MSFSKRYGYKPAEMPFQREGVDNGLRTALWNALSVGIWDLWQPNPRLPETRKIENLVRRLWVHFFNSDLDLLPDFKSGYGDTSAYGVMKQFFLTCKWNEVLDFLEEIAQDNSRLLNPQVRDFINDMLERHNSAYRLVGDEIAEFTSAHEITAIVAAQADAAAPVREHLEAALRMLSDRDKSRLSEFDQGIGVGRRGSLSPCHGDAKSDPI